MHRRAFHLTLGLLMLVGAAPPARPQTANDQSPRIALKGYDPVAYFTVGEPVPGKRDFETVFDGTRYRFASADNKDRFESDPDKYAPQFAGACASGLSLGVKVEADPTIWRIVDGKLYVFAAKSGRDQMDADPAGTISRANEHWKTLKNAPY